MNCSSGMSMVVYRSKSLNKSIHENHINVNLYMLVTLVLYFGFRLYFTSELSDESQLTKVIN
jgi:hypothetical protein